MNSMLIFKEWRENKWILLATFVLNAVITPMYPINYGNMFAYLLGQGTTYEMFVWYDWFMKAQPQIVLIAAIIMGSAAVAREKKNATLAILVTKPIVRTRIYFNKLLAGGVALTAVMSADTFILTLISPMLGAQGMHAGVMLLGVAGDVLLVVPAYLLAAALSAMLDSSIKAGLLTTGAVFILYGPVWVGSNVSVVWWLMNTSGALGLIAALGLAAAGTAFVWLGTRIFRKMDV